MSPGQEALLIATAHLALRPDYEPFQHSVQVLLRTAAGPEVHHDDKKDAKEPVVGRHEFREAVRRMRGPFEGSFYADVGTLEVILFGPAP